MPDTRQLIATDSRSSSSSDSRKLSSQIDVESMMKATRALSSELGIKVLSVKLTKVMMESASGLVLTSSASESGDGFPGFVGVCVKSSETIVVPDTTREDLIR